jgi:Flp pilus assembly pilin Flp
MKAKLNRRILAFMASRQAESGQGLAEFGLILALIAVVCIVAMTAMGQALAGSSGFVDLPDALD